MCVRLCVANVYDVMMMMMMTMMMMKIMILMMFTDKLATDYVIV